MPQRSGSEWKTNAHDDANRQEDALGWLLGLVRFLSAVTVAGEDERWRPGFSVRHDWPDGTHILVGFRRTWAAADRSRRSADRYWRTAPIRPRCSVVSVSFREWDLHRHRDDCRAPDCPVADRPETERVGATR
jgi:hypothetical protein